MMMWRIGFQRMMQALMLFQTLDQCNVLAPLIDKLDDPLPVIGGSPGRSAALVRAANKQNVVDLLNDGGHVADHGDQPAAQCLLSQGVERLVKGVLIEGAEPLVEEERVDTPAGAPGKVHDREGQREAG